MNKTVLLITETDFSEQVYEGLNTLKEEGCKFYLLSDDDFVPKQNIFEKKYIFDICNLSKTICFIKQQNIHFDAVLTKNCELVTPLVACLNREFGNIGEDPKVAFYCRSKYHMRKCLQENNVDQPNFYLCKNKEDIDRAVEEIGVPCVLKPVGGHSSFGTFLVQNKQDLKNAGKKFEECQNYLVQQSQSGVKQMANFTPEELKLMGISDPVDTVTDYLVEEFMEGPEISIDALVQDGNVTIFGIAKQVRMKPPYFVEVSEIMPYTCSQKEKSHIESLVNQTIRALGIKNSATHTEIILTKNGPKIVEIACRMGSDNIHDALYQTTGYHYFYEMIKIALGIKRMYEIKVKAHYAMEYFLPTKEGILKEIIIPSEVRNNPNISEYRIDIVPGSFVAPPPKNFDFIGYIGTRGNTPKVAQKHLKEALGKIQIIYE